jgi:hypothetical protein
VNVYQPATLPANPALVILYHGTGQTPDSFMSDLKATDVAIQRQFIVVAPAAKLNVQGSASDVDHWDSIPYETGWNLIDKDPAANDDVLLTRAVIDAASKAYGINRKRVYTAGLSNGAFFSPMVALLLPNEIAGFGENSGGAIRCTNRGEVNSQWMGTGSSCAALAAEANYPACSSGALKPVPVPTSGRVPRGYLVHYNDDNIVSVAWSCHLASAMGSNATTKILTDGGHALEPNFLDNTWTALSGYSLP